MPWLELIKPILESDAFNSSIAIVILVIVLMFIAWTDERRDKRFVDILKGIYANMLSNTEYNATNIEVLRSLVDDIKEIKNEITPIRVRRRKSN